MWAFPFKEPAILGDMDAAGARGPVHSCGTCGEERSAPLELGRLPWSDDNHTPSPRAG